MFKNTDKSKSKKTIGVLSDFQQLPPSLIFQPLTTTQTFFVPDPGHRCPCSFCYSSSPLRTGSDPNLETRWNLDSGQLGMGVHAGVTLLAPATNPERPSLTTLSKIPPPPLWVTLSTPLFCTIFLHSTYHHLELCTCFLGYFLSPQENTSDMRAGTLSPTSNSICWLHEWSHSV